MPSSGYLSAEMAEGTVPTAATLPAPFNSVSAIQTSSSSNSMPHQRLVAERKWRLGIHARGHPSSLMAELYRVLQVQLSQQTQLMLHKCTTLCAGLLSASHMLTWLFCSFYGISGA